MSPRLGGAAIFIATLCVGLLALEFAFRAIDGYRLDQLPLTIRQGHELGPVQDSLPYAKEIRIDPSFNVDWFNSDPPDYDRTAKNHLPADWVKAIANYQPAPGERAFVKDELKFLYNRNWLIEACKTGAHSNVIEHYKRYPGFVYAFPSPDNSTNPPFRMAPSSWEVGSNYYNNFGFRGPDITPRKAARVIRLAFLGASTTANGWPYTYPEFVGHYLNLWAKAKNLDVRFEVINAGRGGTDSPEIANIMRYEVAPLHPDIVLYYEGANDLHADSIVKTAGVSPPPDNKVLQPNLHLTYLPLEQYSALADRIYELLFRRGGSTEEPPKPPHTLTFDVTQKHVDLSREDLPFRLHGQITDIRNMASATTNYGGQFFMTSFVTLVHNGLRLDPERHRIILQGLNNEYWPLTYAEIREAVDFQNGVYRELAEADHHPFLDVDRYFPQNPDLFADMVHFSTQSGFRLQAWIVAQLLAPYIENAVKAGALPKPAYDPNPADIAWATNPPIKFDLSCLP